MKSRFEIFNADCLEKMESIPDNSIDLVIIDPPYIINQGKSGGAFGKNKQKYHGEISHIIDGFDFNVLEKLDLKMKKTNLYIFCNKTLLFELIKYYQKNRPKLILDILTWEKTNPVPVCSNKYLSDLEYVLFVKEKGVKIAGKFETKRKNYRSPLNVKDKRKYEHPTPKPVPLLKNYIINSGLSRINAIFLQLSLGGLGPLGLFLI